MKFIKKQNRGELIAGVVIAIMLIFLMFVLRDQLNFLDTRESFEQFINNFGPWGPLVIIGIIAIEVVIAPIPGFIPVVSAGFLFGPVEGAIYAFCGNIIGTTTAFWLARKFGKLLAGRFFNTKLIKKYENMIAEHENKILATYFIPIFPVDIISFAFGLSKIKFKKFILVAGLGYIFYVAIFAIFGDYLAQLYF